jgi:hypothetical protein
MCVCVLIAIFELCYLVVWYLDTGVSKQYILFIFKADVLNLVQ